MLFDGYKRKVREPQSVQGVLRELGVLHSLVLIYVIYIFILLIVFGYIQGIQKPMVGIIALCLFISSTEARFGNRLALCQSLGVS